MLQVLEIVFPVFAVAAVGYGYGRWKRPNMTFANQVNMDIFVPALVFWALVDKPLVLADFGGLALAGAGLVLGSGLLVLPLLVLLRVPAATFLPPMMFANTGNLGLPIALAAFGEAMLPAAVILFVVSMFLHFTVGLLLVQGRVSPLGLVRMPVILATLAALACAALALRIPGPLLEAVRLLGQVSIPLMLFALGVRLVRVDLTDWRVGVAGAVLCPLSGLVSAALLARWLGLAGPEAGLLLVFGALPPAVLNYIIAEQFNREPQAVASIVILGNLASVVILPMLLAHVLAA